MKLQQHYKICTKRSTAWSTKKNRGGVGFSSVSALNIGKGQSEPPHQYHPAEQVMILVV